MDTTGLRIERINISRIAADEDSSIHYGLPVESRRAGKSEGPFDFQPRDLARRQTRGARRLETRVGEIALSVPCGRVQIPDRRMTGAGIGHVLYVADTLFVEFPASHVLGEQALLGIGEARRIILH